MTGKEKQNMLIWMGVILIVIFSLAISLSELNFQPGMPMPEVKNDELLVIPPSQTTFVAISINQFLSIFFAILVGGLFFYVIYQLVKGSSWKDIWNYVRVLIAVSFALFLVLGVILLMPGGEKQEQIQSVLPTPAPPVTAPLGPVPSILIWIVSIGLLVTGVLIAIVIYRSLSEKKSTLDLLGIEAEKARQDLLSGIDLKDVIIRCYTQMSLVLQQDRGLERSQSMTTMEFEKLLVSEKVPVDPVRELTRLFNLARYGNWKPGSSDEQSAIRSFNAIADHCRQLRDTR